MSENLPELFDDAPPMAPGPRGLWPVIATVALIVVAALATSTRIYNYDIFWHLISGQWMLQHGRVLGFDPFSIDPPATWVNVHWLFQIIVAGLHRVGGFAVLTGLKAALGAATMLIFALALRRHVSPAWLMVTGLFMLLAMFGRVRVRPESFTYAFLMLTIVLVDSVRRGASPRRLWWLVPMVLAWVNMHGLYILGVGVMWSAVGGAWLDRRLKRRLENGLLRRAALAPLLAATVVVLITPWPIEVALHPLLLWTRVSGAQSYYTLGVSELVPTWQHLGNHIPDALLVLYAVGAIFLNRRRLPTAHVIWLAAFTALALLAARNVGLLGPMAGFLTAWHGGCALRRIAAEHPRLARVGPWLAGLTTAAAVAMIPALVTSAAWRLTGSNAQFGFGLMNAQYPLATGEYLSSLDAKGDIFCYNFGDASTFIYTNYPKRRVYMDGRLELHSLDRFVENYRILRDLRTPEGAQRAALPDEVRFLHVRHDRADVLSALQQANRFTLIHVDPVGACFARSDWTGLGEPFAPISFAEYDLPLGRDGLVEEFGFIRKSFWHQNPRSVNYRLGSVLLSLGRQDRSGPVPEADDLQRRCTLLAIRHLTAALNASPRSPAAVRSILAEACHIRAVQCELRPSGPVPVDMNAARALALYRELNPLDDLSTTRGRSLAIQYIIVMKDAHQIDAAQEAIEEYLRDLPPELQIKTPRENLTFRDSVVTAAEVARARAAELAPRKLSTLERANALTAGEMGLILQAVSELQAIPQPTPQEQLKLGDLLLRQGRHAEARDIYARVTLPPAEQWQIALRSALCDWASGELYIALDSLKELAGPNRPLAAYYLATLAELLGRYDLAGETLRQTSADPEDLGPLLREIRNRLMDYAAG